MGYDGRGGRGGEEGRCQLFVGVETRNSKTMSSTHDDYASFLTFSHSLFLLSETLPFCLLGSRALSLLMVACRLGLDHDPWVTHIRSHIRPRIRSSQSTRESFFARDTYVNKL